VRRRCAALLALVALCAAAPPMRAAAGPFPDRPIRVLAGEAGAQSDTMARVLAPVLAATLGQPVVVENRSGAGGTIAALRTVQSRPDGYTLLLGGANNVVLGPLVRRDLAYDPSRDLVPLGGVGRAPYGVAVAKHVDAADLAGFVAYARARPGELAFGSSGVGSSSHAALALLASRAGLSLLHVPYRGSPLALNDLVAGRIDVFACDLSLLLPYAFVALLGVGLLAVTLISISVQTLVPDTVVVFGHNWYLPGLSGSILYLLGLATEALMIAAIYHFLPVGRIPLRYALVGGITATALWEIIRHVLVWYFNGLSNASVVYGSLTSAVVILFSLEIAATLLLLGAEVIAEYERLESPPSDSSPDR